MKGQETGICYVMCLTTIVWQKYVLGEKQVAGTVSGWISYVFLSLLGLPYPEPNQANELSPILIHTNKA